MPRSPHSVPAVFISEIPVVVHRGGNVHVTYRSGGSEFERVMPRHLWRRFIEQEIRALNEVEAGEAGRVRPLGPPRKRRANGRTPGGGEGEGAGHRS